MKGERGRERGMGLGRERRWVQVFRNSWSTNEKKGGSGRTEDRDREMEEMSEKE